MRIAWLFMPLLLLTTACGFHLRGSQPQAEVDAVSSLYIRADRAGNIAGEVTAQLKQAGITITSETGQAEYTLTLANERFDRDVLSVSAQTGKAEEYRLIMTVQMSVTHRDDGLLLDNDIAEVTRDYTFDEDAVLGKFSEEQVLREEMTRRAASQIVSRLNATARNR